ncbi:hypothetical protein BASA81_007731 [Batrachochytrium salamandrivorans]|nr:hypothetical protein BASA81_007731 [Batrachochytrium salamandrivorans]
MASSPSFTLEQVLHDARAHTFFLDYLQRKQAEALLLFWSDCEQFKQLMGNTVEIQSEVSKIQAIHFSPKSRTAQLLGSVETKRVLQRSGLDTFTSAQKECTRLLKANYFPGFTQSKSFTDLVNELRELKQWTLFDAFRDARRVKALHLLMQVERPEFLDTLKFALDLRNRYKPLVAEALAPKSAPKLQIIRQLIDMAKQLEKKYLNSADKQYFARGVSGTSMARTKMSLDDMAHKFDLLTAQPTAASQSSATSVSSPATPKKPTAASSSSRDHLVTPEELIRSLGDAFKQVEEEALAWLERVAMVDARKTDYFLTPINEPREELEFNPGSILVFTCTPSEYAFRVAGPHTLHNSKQRTTGKLLSSNSMAQTTHWVKLDTVFVSNKEDASQYASDITGATASTNAKGMKFRTKIMQKITFPHVKPIVRVEDEPLGSTKVTSLAGVSQLESIAENNARTRSAHQFNSGSGLENTELHAFCFPLALGVDIDVAEAIDTTTYHSFVSPCRTIKHSFAHNCQCLFGVCKTEVKTKPLVVSRNDHDLNHSSLLSDVTSSGIGNGAFMNTSFSFKRSLVMRKTYSECAIWLEKVPNFGLGLNLALNRDGSVVVTRFVSDVHTPSPAASSGRIQVEDELLQVNNVPTYGRKFDDIVNQIKCSPSPVYLRFARGNYLDSVFSNPRAGTTREGSTTDTFSFATTATTDLNLQQVLDESNAYPMIEQQTFQVYSPETTCMLSNAPVFAEMQQALEQNLKQLPSNTLVKPLDVRECLFSFLSVSHVVDVLASLLLERRVVVCSDFPDRIAPAVMCLLQLMRPFSWQYEFVPLLPELHWDWMSTKTPASPDKPSLIGVCTADVCPPSASNHVAPRRNGRLTLREDDWSARERDFETPMERLRGSGGLVRGVVASYFNAKDNVCVDLDADDVSLASNHDHFPAEVREFLIGEFNLALGKGGWSKQQQHGHAPSQNETERVSQALAKAFRMLAMDRVIDFTLSLKEGGVVGFYRHAFLAVCATPDSAEFLERFTKTETFREFTTSEWNLRENAN